MGESGRGFGLEYMNNRNLKKKNENYSNDGS